MPTLARLFCRFRSALHRLVANLARAAQRGIETLSRLLFAVLIFRLRCRHMKQPHKSVAQDNRFLTLLGYFHAIWASVDLVLCYGIGDLLKIGPGECHVLTAGMEFGPKITVLRNVIYRSKHPKRNELLGLLGKLQNESKRNVLTHAFMLSDEHKVIFIERSRGGDYRAQRHEFTLDEFAQHVLRFGDVVNDLTAILCPDYAEFNRFGYAAFSTESKPTKSPTPPSSKA